jgi:preprotein translocase subunit SecG
MIHLLYVVHILVCVFLIMVVLLQAGKGGGMGIAFGGGGGSQTVFGSSGAGNFLTRLTSITAFLFLLTSLTLAHFSSQQDSARLQHIAERKSAEKKADDARAAKLKVDLDKARESVSKTAGGAVTAPAPTTSDPMLPALPAPALTVPKRGDKPAGKTDDDAAATKPEKKKAAEATTDEKPAPRRHKRVAAPAAGEPAKTGDAPSAAPPAPAPANE